MGVIAKKMIDVDSVLEDRRGTAFSKKG